MLGQEGYKEYLKYSTSKLTRALMKTMKVDRNPATIEIYERNVALLVKLIISYYSTIATH